MKNTNYNVLKLLHSTLDNLWRIEKHYLADATGAPCQCPELLKEMQSDLKKQSQMLTDELAAHQKADGLS